VSAELVEQYAFIHSKQKYGAAGLQKAHYILSHLYRVKPQSVIDYGCGRSRLPDLLRYLGVPKVTCYDPAIPAYAARPDAKHDLLISVDVMEHLPEDEVDGVLSDMASLGTYATIVINTRLAKTILPDGRNAHLTVRPASWWLESLKRHWPEAEQIAMTPTYQAAFKTWPTTWAQVPAIAISRSWHRQMRRVYQRAVDQS
jgi:hypothetical protein